MSVKNPLIEWEVLRIAREMIEFDARTRVVAEVTGLSEAKARAMYRARHGKPQKTGNLAGAARSYISTPSRRLHASLVCGVHGWLAEHRGRRDADTLLGTFRLYERVCRGQGIEPRFDFNGVYRIVRLLGCDRLATARCRRCGCGFARDPDEDWYEPARTRRRLCPACEHVEDRRARCARSKAGAAPRRRDACVGDRPRAARPLHVEPYAPVRGAGR